MSTQTTNIGLTKVVSSETIGDFSNAMNGSGGNLDIIDTKMGAVGNTSLQAQITALNSQMTTITNLTSNITKASKYSNATIEVRKIARICFLEIYIPSSISVSEGDYLTDTLPNSAKPWITNRFVAVKGSSAFVIGFSDNKLQIYTTPPSGSAGVYLSASYIANAV